MLPQNPDNPTPPPHFTWFEKAVIVAVLLAATVAISPNAADADLWGHVQYGRDALRDGLAATTTYSYTADGYRWINHENLAELLLAVGADNLGPIGLLVVKGLLGTFVIGMVLLFAIRNGCGMLATAGLSLLVAVNLAYHWSLRPQLLSFVYLTLMVMLLNWCFHGWEGKWHLRRKSPPTLPTYYTDRIRSLWLAPVLFLFWANSHGGFIAGFCILVAYLGLRSVEAFVCGGRSSLPLIGRFSIVVLASGLATLINPYGHRLHAWLLESLTVPRPEITEWHAPDLLDPRTIPLWLIVAAFVLVNIVSRRSRDFTHLVLLCITLWQSVSHQRHIPFFAIPFGFWMAPHFDAALRRFGMGAHRDPLSAANGIGKTVAVTTLLGLYAFLGFRLYGRLHDLPVQRSQFPVSAFQYISNHDLRGRLVVTYNWAQYAIAAFGTPRYDSQIEVGFDGRFRTCYPQQIVDMHFDLVLGNGGPNVRHRSTESLAFDAHRVLDFGRPNLALINRFQPYSVKSLEQTKDWVLLYQDAVAQLWGRRSVYDDPLLSTYLAPADREISDARQDGSVTWPALPRPRKVAGEAKAGTRGA